MAIYRVTDPATGKEVTTSDFGTANAYATAEQARWSNKAVNYSRAPSKTTGQLNRFARVAAPGTGAVVRDATGAVVAAGYPDPRTGINDLSYRSVQTGNAKQNAANAAYNQQVAAAAARTEIRLTSTPLASPTMGTAPATPGPLGAAAAIATTTLGAAQGFLEGGADYVRKNPAQAALLALPFGAVALGGLAAVQALKGGVNMPYGVEAPGGAPLLGGILGKKGMAGDTVLGTSHGYLLIQSDVDGRIHMVKRAKHSRRRRCGGSGSSYMNKLMQIAMMKAMLK